MFGYASGNNEVAAATGFENSFGVAIFRVFDDERVPYEGKLDDLEAFLKFVTAHSLPLFVPYSSETAPQVFGGKIEHHVLLFADLTSDSGKRLLGASRPVAEARRGEAIFVTLDQSDDRVLEFFDVDPYSDFPTLRIVHMHEDGIEKYAPTAVEEGFVLDSSAIETFVDGYFAGKLEKLLKSEEPAVEPQPDDAVHMIVGKTFEEKVNTPGKGVFVEFYAPWCLFLEILFVLLPNVLRTSL